MKLLPPVLSAALVAGGLALMTASPSGAAPVKLYFHSENGGYQADFQSDPTGLPADSAPAGSTLSATKPTATTDATALSVYSLDATLAGSPHTATFALPFKGDVTSVCVDIWARATSTDLAPLITYSLFNTPTAWFSNEDIETADYAGGGEWVRVTKLVKPEGGKVTLPDATEFFIGGYPDVPDWEMAYDSVLHPSSITLNATECKPTPVPTVAPSATATPSASATVAPSGSATATATPSATATATPSASATATPSGTPSPTATPTPSPTTPPPPARETGLDYTGATTGRYSDSALVSAKATLPDGSPVPTGNVEFAVGSDKVTLPVNSEGVASGRLPLRATRPGEYLMTVRYVTNSAYIGSAEQVPFVVQRMGTRCAIARSTSGSNYVVTGTLRDALGRVLANQMVTFSYNGKAFRSLRTDRNGRAQASIAAKRGTYTVSLPTTSHYAGCSASFRV